MYEDLKGKVAVVTGSGSEAGIGFAIADKLAQSGATICLADLAANKEKVARLAEKLRDSWGVTVLELDIDVTSITSIDNAVAAVRERFGGVDILINNAGAVFGAPSSVAEYDEAAWQKTMDVNLTGTLRLSQKFYTDLETRKGCIVNTASTAGKGPHRYAGAYSCAKTAVIMLTKVMAMEAGPSGIRVNAICPGLIKTDLMELRIELEAKAYGITPAEQEARLNQSVPLQRMAAPSEVAAVAAFLSSQEASYINGQAINVCGGRTMAL